MATRPFGLRDDPFVEGHDRRLVHPHRGHREAVERMTRAIEQGVPFVLVSGPGGGGKTTALLATLATVPPAACVTLTANPALGIAELHARLLAALGAAAGGPASDDATLAAAFAAQAADAPTLVLAIDEAQELPDALLEELRRLSNLESHGHKALCVVLAAGPELARRLEQPEHQALRQRIAVRCTIEPLSARETEAMLHHRVAVCGGAGACFPRVTCRAVHALTHGVPREIQSIAGEALAQAHAAGAKAVEPAHVEAAARSLGFRSVIDSPQPTSNPLISRTPVVEADAPAPIAEPEAATPAPVPDEVRPSEPSEPEPSMVAAGVPGPDPAAEPLRASAGPIAPNAAAALPPAKVEAWLSRFRDPNGPPRIGSRVSHDEPVELAHAAETGESAAGEEGAAEGEAGAAPPRPRPRRAPGRVVGRGRPRPSRWARRRHTGRWIAVALVAGAIAGFLLWRAHPLALPGAGRAMPAARSGAGSTASPPTSLAPGLDARAVASSPGVTVAPLRPLASGPSRATRPGLPPTAPSAPNAISGRAAASAAADTTRRYLVVVGSFLVEERAHSERDRIALLTPLRCHVLHGHEDGADVFRIMVGPLTSRREAERVGEELFSEGAVSEARVVRWYGGDFGHR